MSTLPLRTRLVNRVPLLLIGFVILVWLLVAVLSAFMLGLYYVSSAYLWPSRFSWQAVRQSFSRFWTIHWDDLSYVLLDAWRLLCTGELFKR